MKIAEIIKRSLAIREAYHALEQEHHGSHWSIAEDALAYMSDAGLVARDTMARQERWPKAGADDELEHKLAENIWWLIVLAHRQGIDIEEALASFLSTTERGLGVHEG